MTQQLEDGIKKKLVLLEVLNSEVDAASGMEPVYSGERVVGRVSSGGYGHRTGKSLALAYVDMDARKDALTVKILGQQYPVVITKGDVYDPEKRETEI